MATKTTKLDSVNIILSNIGQAPVTALDTGNPLVETAELVLNEINRTVQAEGWVFNTEYCYPLLPNVDDEIVNVVSFGNRAFFENASTDRQGLEGQIQADITDSLKLTLSYTYSDFEFDSFDSQPEAVGQPLPGIPEHQLFAELAYNFNSGGYVVWDAINVGEFTANNAGTLLVDSYIVSNLRIGSDYAFNGGQQTISPFLGINNLFDEDYFANVRVNAFGGRAYEPAPERHIYGGFNVRF